MAGSAQATRPSRRKVGWVWFFVILTVLTVTGIVLQLWFNLSQQATPERLMEARRLWDAHGVSDYTLEYLILEKSKDAETYTVKVVQGQVDSAVTGNGRRLKPGEIPFRSVDALFDRAHEWLDASRQPGSPSTYVAAAFDPIDGHPVRLVRSVRSTRERVEITVALRR